MRAGCLGWVALLSLKMPDLIIKLHLPNAVSMQGQTCRRMPIIGLIVFTMKSNNLLSARFDN